MARKETKLGKDVFLLIVVWFEPIDTAELVVNLFTEPDFFIILALIVGSLHVCLVPGSRYFASVNRFRVTWSKAKSGSSSRIRHQNQLTMGAWGTRFSHLLRSNGFS